MPSAGSLLLLLLPVATALLGGEDEIVTTKGSPAFAGIVRGNHYTLLSPSGCNIAGAECSPNSLDPICGTGENCDGSGSGIDVRFNSRSYALSSYDGSCKGSKMGDRYSCVNYNTGAFRLAGRTLSYTIDLSKAGCGCNAAIYLVSMPQNADPTSCGDYYCGARASPLPATPCPRHSRAPRPRFAHCAHSTCRPPAPRPRQTPTPCAAPSASRLT